MKKVVILDSAYPVNSRNIRLYDYLKSTHQMQVITWDRRANSDVNNLDYTVYKKKVEYGDKIKKLLYLKGYYAFVKEKILLFEPEVVIASNWDMLLIASKVKKELDFNLIYENRDMINSNSNGLKKVLAYLENKAMKNTNSMIVASRYFEQHYRFYKKPILTIENKLPITLNKLVKTKSDVLRISYIGTVRFYDILINFIESTKDLKVRINIFGDGPDKSKIEDYVQRREIKNVYIHGEFKYENIGEIYSETDVVWSVYPNKKNSNKRFVIPNKYFESLYFETPGIFPEKTRTGLLVKDGNFGYVVNPYSHEEIKNLIIYILNNNDDLVFKRRNIRETEEIVCWESEVEKIDNIL